MKKSLSLLCILSWLNFLACQSISDKKVEPAEEGAQVKSADAIDSADALDSLDSMDAMSAFRLPRGVFTVSFYDPSRLSTRCPAPKGLSSSNGISPAEGAFGIVCNDNWIALNNPADVPDVEYTDIQHVKAKGYNINSNEEYLKLALEKCNGKCVRMRNNRYEINVPQCKKMCSNRTYYLKTNKSGRKSFKVFVESACPARHWKNYFKAAVGVDDNHCDRANHVDVSTGMFSSEFGFTPQMQDRVLAYIIRKL